MNLWCNLQWNLCVILRAISVEIIVDFFKESSVRVQVEIIAKKTLQEIAGRTFSETSTITAREMLPISLEEVPEVSHGLT